jgi:hypothetical protein
MIEPGVMRSHALKKVLPFALTLFVGVALSGHAPFKTHRASRRAVNDPVAQGIAHGRTWLIVHSQPVPVLVDGFYAQKYLSHPTVIAVRLDANGSVSRVAFDANDLPPSVAGAITDAVSGIKFSPPTEDGMPLAVTGETTCGLDVLVMGESIGASGHKHSFQNLAPSCTRLKIVSIEGARESEGWRVIYE